MNTKKKFKTIFQRILIISLFFFLIKTIKYIKKAKTKNIKVNNLCKIINNLYNTSLCNKIINLIFLSNNFLKKIIHNLQINKVKTEV